MKGVGVDTRDTAASRVFAGAGSRTWLLLCALAGFGGLCSLPDTWLTATAWAQSALDEEPGEDEPEELPEPLPEGGQPWDPKKTIWEPQEPIVEVRIEGNVTIPSASIAKHIKTRAGRIPTSTQVRDDVKALYATRWFLSVEPVYRRGEQGLTLVFVIRERPILKKVEYKGNTKIKTKHLEPLVGLKAGSGYSVGVNREAVRRLQEHYKEKGYFFATVELEKGNEEDDREVVFLINEGKKVHVTDLEFHGNKFFSTPLLKTKLKTKTQKIWLFGGQYDPSNRVDDVASLRDYYHGLGFFDAKINADVKFNEDRSKATMVYTITEGIRFKVRNVEIVGNSVLSEETLRPMLKLTGNEYFNAAKLTKDREGIVDKYGELGRIFAQVNAVPRYLEEPGQVDVVYNFDEDRVYRIRRIEVAINGEHPHTKESVVLNNLLFSPGDPANRKLIEKSEARLGGSGYFANNRMEGNAPKIDIRKVEDGPAKPGYDEIIRARPLSEPARPKSTSRSTPKPISAPRQQTNWRANTRDLLPRQAALRSDAPSLIFSEEPIEKLIVRGQDPADDSPVFNANPQGDPFGGALENPAPIDQPPGWIDVLPEVTETQTGRLMFGVGVNSNAGVVGSIVLDEGNFDILRPPSSFRDFVNGTAFRGGGQQFRVEALPGNQVSRYSVTWRDPYFMDTQYSLGVSGFYFTRFYRDWYETRTGGRITVGKQFTPFTSGTLAFRLEDVELTNPTVPTPPLLQESLGHNFLSSARIGLQHDTRDSGFLASEGHFVEAAYEQAYGDFVFPRFDLEGRQYFTVVERPDGGGRHIVALRGQASWTGSDTPIFERLYAGGFQSFRGFRFRGVTPFEGKVGVGGTFLATGSVEYMFPFTADETIRGVVFSDFGTVDNSVTFNNFRATAGAGVRLTIPAMGPVPIALDFAWPITRQPQDITQVFSFYVGFLR
jgi:outer membrane protein insertion porin family